MNNTGWAISIVLMVLVSTTLVSQAPAQQGPEMAKKLADNYSKLRQYSWNSRTEVRLQGQQQIVSMEKMRYDLDGYLQPTPIGGSGQLSPEMHGLVDGLVQLGFSYAQPDPDKAEQFMRRASVWEGRRGDVGTLRAEGEDFIVEGDMVDLRAQSQRPERVTVESSYQGLPVTIRADYRGLLNKGPDYVARLLVRLPSQGIDVIIENFDYQLSQGIAASDVSILPEGTVLNIRITQPLSSAKNQSGQEFRAILDRDLKVHSRVAAAKGSEVTGKLVYVEGSGRASGRAKMSLTLTGITVNSQALPIKTNVLSFEAEATHRKDARRIGGSAGIGALIGGIAGGGSGAVKGAVVGGGVGTAATLLTKGTEVEFGAEQQFEFSLLEELEITPR